MPFTPTDEELVARVKKGDQPSYDTLMKRHERLVAKAVSEVTRDLAAVEDLMQEVFMKVFRKVGLYDPKLGKFTVWLVTVARREAINYLRRRKRHSHVSLDNPGAPEGFSPLDRPSQQASKKEVWNKVLSALDDLSEPARTILKKRMLEGTSFDDIARILKKPLDTVKTIYYRNTEALRKKLAIPNL
jgi:RNA polymerase sigma-70 factor (ECF subfamily)